MLKYNICMEVILLDNKLYLLINGAKKIAIFSHITPDADALCSSFALRNIINNNLPHTRIPFFLIKHM